MPHTPRPAGFQSRQRVVAGAVLATALAMVGMAYAAVPLYKAFCQATGYGGTTQVARQGTDLRGARTLTVRFDTNIASGLPWTLTPETRSIEARTGETQTVFFKVRNLSDKPFSGVAGYNVSPDQSGSYFDKINCFCFSEQHLGPGETAEWPVVFYLDPALEKDETMAHVDSVTLSYVMYPSRRQPGSTPEGAKF